MARRTGLISALAQRFLGDGYSAYPPAVEPEVRPSERGEFVESSAVESIRAFFNDAEAELLSISLRRVNIGVNVARGEVVDHQPGQQ